MTIVIRGALLLPDPPEIVRMLRSELDLHQLAGLVRSGLPFPLTHSILRGLSQHRVSSPDVHGFHSAIGRNQGLHFHASTNAHGTS